jgi:DNA polymerase-3 subunit epsilon
MNRLDAPWHEADLVALDLEGSGAQDHEDEAILEIAVVPLRAGRPVLTDAYSTMVNPGRPIPRRPWISPGLTNDTLRSAPSIAEIEAELAARINGRYIVGHNVGVDWRLLHRRCPALAPAGLLDTLRLARKLKLGTANSLTALLDHLNLTAAVNAVAPQAQPHRALWDTAAAAILLPVLVDREWHVTPTLAALAQAAELLVTGRLGTPTVEPRQGSLF